MTYGIKKSKLTDKLAFSGPCPVCASDLKLKEEEIGKRQPCPNCRAIVRPVSAILKAYKLNESNKTLEDTVTVLNSRLRSTESLLKQQVASLIADRDELQAKLATTQEQCAEAVSQVIDLQAEQAVLRAKDHDGGPIVQDDFLPDLNLRQSQPQSQPQVQPQVQPQAPYPHPHQYYPPKSSEGTTPGVAALLSFFFPGLGQICQGRVGAGLAFMFASFVGYCFFILPGLIIHLISVGEAASHKPE